jgi:hypothetical protein
MGATSESFGAVQAVRMPAFSRGSLASLRIDGSVEAICP